MFKYLSLARLSYALSKLYTKVKSNFAAKNHSHTKSQITDFPSSLPANGGDADTVNGHTVNDDVPSNAKFTDTVYTHPTSAGNKHIPSGGSDGQVLKYGGSSGTATWGTICTTDTYGDYVKE